MSVEICAVWVTQRHAVAFLKSVKQKSNFSQTFEWQGILRRKTNKSYDKSAVGNDPGNSTQKIVNFILENAMRKAKAQTEDNGPTQFRTTTASSKSKRLF